jgi:hypothetical protein
VVSSRADRKIVGQSAEIAILRVVHYLAFVYYGVGQADSQNKISEYYSGDCS